MKITPIRIATLLLALGLTACGGGDDATTTTTTTPTTETPSASCTDPTKTLTYSANAMATGNPFTDGQEVCFEASSTSLAFDGKTLTNPVQNTAVTAPYAAYTFTDGSYKLEVVFNAGALYEINVVDGSGSTFFGQFAFPAS